MARHGASRHAAGSRGPVTKRIAVIYKCASCMTEERTFDMVARGAGEHIEGFMTRVGRELAKDHQRASPLCTSATAEYVKIPSTEEGVGVAG